MNMNAPDLEDDAADREHPDGDDQDRDGGCPRCTDCDPGLLARLKCEAAGIAEEAAYNATAQPELDTARTAYTSTRKEYRDKRHELTLVVQDLNHQLRHLIERVRCLILQDRVVQGLDEAFACVCAELDECGPAGGCCADESCRPDASCPDDYDELVQRITSYEAWLQKNKDCFASLLTEPAALATRVAAIKTDVDGIAASLAADPATTDLKKVYAQALVTERKLAQVWNGFAETGDFVDCLCRTMTCWTKLAHAVSVLRGARAVQDFHRAAHAAHCKELSENTVDEILLAYERPCGCDHDQDDGEGDGHHHGDEHGHEHGHGHGHCHHGWHHHHHHHGHCHCCAEHDRHDHDDD